jgi:hypothetical protein
MDAQNNSNVQVLDLRTVTSSSGPTASTLIASVQVRPMVDQSSTMNFNRVGLGSCDVAVEASASSPTPPTPPYPLHERARPEECLLLAPATTALQLCHASTPTELLNGCAPTPCCHLCTPPPPRRHECNTPCYELLKPFIKVLIKYPTEWPIPLRQPEPKFK